MKSMHELLKGGPRQLMDFPYWEAESFVSTSLADAPPNMFGEEDCPATKMELLLHWID